MCIFFFVFLTFIVFLLVVLLLVSQSAGRSRETNVVHHQYVPPPMYPPAPPMYPPPPYPPPPIPAAWAPEAQLYPAMGPGTPASRAPAGKAPKTNVLGVDMVYLVGAEGKMVILSDGDTMVGRESDNAIVVADDSASRRHACVRRVGKKLDVTDLGSGNGTFVNDVRIAANVSHPVRPGDRIQFGAVTVFTVGGAS